MVSPVKATTFIDPSYLNINIYANIVPLHITLPSNVFKLLFIQLFALKK